MDNSKLEFMNEDYFNRRISEIVGGGEFSRIEIEPGKSGSWLAFMPKDTPKEKVDRIRKYYNISDRYTVKFHYKKDGQERIFPVSVKVFQETDRHAHRLPHGISVDAYVEFIYRALYEMGCNSFFDTFYDRFPEQRAVVTEYVDWPTAMDTAGSISSNIYKKYGKPSSVIAVPEIEQAKKELESVLASVINDLANFHVFASRLWKRVKPRAMKVYEDGKLVERECYFFEDSVDHTLDRDIIALKSWVGEERFVEMNSSGKMPEIREMFRVLHKDGGIKTPVHGDLNAMNIAIRKREDGFYDVKFLDPEKVKLWNPVTDLVSIMMDIHFLLMFDVRKDADSWGEGREKWLDFYLSRVSYYNEWAKRIEKFGEKLKEKE